MFAFPDKTVFQFPKPILAILIATTMLAGLLIFNTIQNSNREQKIMKDFLLDEGLTLIRSFEAGARTTMMHEMMGGDLPIKTLIRETAKAERIAYIFIVSKDGTVVASAGNHNLSAEIDITHKVLESREAVTTIINDKNHEPIFEVATIFQSLPAQDSPAMGMTGRHRWRRKSKKTDMLEKGQTVIHLGLRTKEFVQAGKQDFTYSLFMGSLLLLLGSGGFYFLFLYQGMRVTRTTLANMKLYTRNIIESMPDGLLTLDSLGRIEACNPKVREFTALDLATMKGKRPEDLFNKWPSDSWQNNRGNNSFFHTFHHKNGNEVPVEISSSSLRDEQGRQLGTVFLLRDLREIRSMEEQLERSRRLIALGRMAAGIAHEIRNPLGTLRGFAQYFGSRAEDSASKEYSTLMIGEVDRLNESISSLLQFSRPREPEFSTVDSASLIKKACKLLEHDFRESNITLVKQADLSGEIEADGDQLLQVMLNLLKNAINASENGAAITLSCKENEEKICITVADNGIGMNREEQKQMFDPFFTTRKTGTGLGLAVSHQIIEQHNGSFDVKSRPGKGTAITIILPKKQNR